MSSTDESTQPRRQEPARRPRALPPEERERIRAAAQETAGSWPPMSEELVKLTRNLMRTART
ncbi:hypothetical protein brsh051_11480 [Brooklawnia propionicigenes]|uniref:Uncharacterized protein n=1 Tax=Brooklawnia propionicigenes TaxID=3041175 RepID=A0AAN0K9G0_9ACTN|nr:hypothetical protein [Brooklawnia sp. SH051]BEH01867.1 hypothetical protein brsh051_11480 [Brooklawnia sp. SH051]